MINHRPPPAAILLDMDGVLYHGGRPLAGAASFLAKIADWPHAFITNNPIRTPEHVAQRMADMGLPRPDPDSIFTSARATADWLAQDKPGFRYFAVGAAGLDLALRRVGTADAERADFVVVGEGEGLDFRTLTIGINLILKQGARLVATNPDNSVDASENGRHLVLPGGGALVAPFAVATGTSPTIIGKPEPLLYQMALQYLGCPAEQCLMIGDRLDTDIVGAARVGMWTALVRSGRFAPGDPWPAGQARPDWDVDDLSGLERALKDLFAASRFIGI